MEKTDSEKSSDLHTSDHAGEHAHACVYAGADTCTSTLAHIQRLQ